MTSCKGWLAALAVGWLGTALAAGQDPATAGTILTEVRGGRYQAGQVWKVKARPGEEGARLTVLKVESAADAGVIVHVSVSGVHVKVPGAPGGFNDTLPHAPLTEAAVARSVTELVGQTGTLPAFQKGYALWREAWDAGKGGVFTISVAEALDALERALRR